MKLSTRINCTQFSPIRKLMPFAEEAKKNGRKVYPLNIGQPDIETPEEFSKAILNYSSDILKYSNSKGDKKLRDSFVTYYDKNRIHLTPEDILITSGASEAILFSLITICDYGDEILVPEPFYANYAGFAQMAGVKIVPITTKVEDRFHLPPLEEIEKRISSKTRAILFSNPGNPTGVVYTFDELKMISKIALKHDLFILSDEVYREFVYDDVNFISMMEFNEVLDRVILVDSISKRYSACGARIGMMISKNKDLMFQVMKLSQARLCVPTIEQFAAAELINTPNAYFNEVVEEYCKRRDTLYDELIKIPGIICDKPSGAFYITAKLPIESSEHFAKWMLQEYSLNNSTVFVTPAEDFYVTEGLGKNEIRLSYCIKSSDLKKSGEILKDGLKKYISIYK